MLKENFIYNITITGILNNPAQSSDDPRLYIASVNMGYLTVSGQMIYIHGDYNIQDNLDIVLFPNENGNLNTKWVGYEQHP